MMRGLQQLYEEDEAVDLVYLVFSRLDELLRFQGI